ncbi:MAG: hypothetical protein ACRDDH_16905 [Cetobacterium sp.]|uniref:hypothetical protein n=1 Tax=Cetobacterium sp. TaxID=2071632 RepID=UPI003EE539F2
MKFKSFFFFFLTSVSFAYINVYPLSFDQRIDSMGGVKDFILTNTTNKVMKYQINILKNDDINDMTSWTEIYPRTLTLKPGAKGEIKMYTRAPKGTILGEYSTILNIKELEVPKERKNKKKSVNIFTNLKIKLYGYVGKLDSSISLKNIKVFKGKNLSNINLNGVLKNESLRRVNLEIVLADSNEKNSILISETKLKKGEEIDLSNLKVFKDSRDEDQNYSKLNYIYIYEKGVGKFLKREKIGS